MLKIILLLAMLAILAAAVGATTLTLKPASQQPVDRAIVTTHLQKLRGQLALP
jgi:hypothetical protein